jgi:preprotein translocase subunit SecG
VLGGLFIVLSIVMAAIAGATRTPTKIDTSLAGKTVVPSQQSQPTPNPATPAPAPTTAPQQQNQQAPAVPLAQ